MFKNICENRQHGRGQMGVSRGRKAKEQTLVRTIVVLIRNTTWRCGKLEKSIVNHLYKKNTNFGKKDISVGDIIQNLDLKGQRKDECLDALKRLEKRNIVKLFILPR
jgi:hypothetical protein